MRVRDAPRAPQLVAATSALGDPLPTVREAVRDILTACPAYAELDADKRRQLASAMVRVCYAAASLIREEVDGGGEIPLPSSRPLARAQGASGDFGGAARQVAATTKAILNAVSFPTFVTDLINGVFRAMIASSQTQMQSYIELLNGVAASTEGFGDAQGGVVGARAWLVDHYPESFEFESELDDEDPESLTPEERAELEQERKEIKVRARPNGTPPSPEALRVDLGLAPNESVPSTGNPESGLVPLVRRRLAKMRQEMLATLVQMGMQRIVVDSGRITASMRFHIDTRDALARNEGSRFATEHELAAKGSFGAGPWGVSASARSNISYVSTQKTQATQELNTDLDLNSSVEINFKSDYVPLNKLASPGQADAIRANSRNPAAETSDAEREKRIAGARGAESKRGESIDKLLMPTAHPPLEAATPPPPKAEAGKKDTPAKDAPAKDAPAKDAPAKDAPAKDAPAKDSASKDTTAAPPKAPPGGGGAKKPASGGATSKLAPAPKR
jgi:hypothetical protein